MTTDFDSKQDWREIADVLTLQSLLFAMKSHSELASSSATIASFSPPLASILRDACQSSKFNSSFLLQST